MTATRPPLRILLFLALAIHHATPASASQWQIDASKSTLRFEALVQSAPLHGTFETFDAMIEFDESDLPGSSISASINLTSLKTDNVQAARMLTMADWLATARFPVAHFNAMQIEKTDGGYVARGTLDLRGKSMPLDLPFTLIRSGQRAEVRAEFKINRSDYGIGTGNTIVAPDVVVRLHIHAVVETRE